MLKKIEWEIMIEIENCTIDGKVLSYEMSPEFTIWFLGHKHNFKLVCLKSSKTALLSVFNWLTYSVTISNAFL